MKEKLAEWLYSLWWDIDDFMDTNIGKLIGNIIPLEIGWFMGVFAGRLIYLYFFVYNR